MTARHSRVAAVDAAVDKSRSSAGSASAQTKQVPPGPVGVRSDTDGGSKNLGQSPGGAFQLLGRPDEEIAVWLRRAYADLGDSGFTQRGYRRWRQEQVAATGEAIPSVEQLRRFYGSFSEAAHVAIANLPRRGLRLASPARVRAHERAAARTTAPDAKSRSATRRAHVGVPAAAAAVVSTTASGTDNAPSALRAESSPRSRLQVILPMLDRLPFDALRELERALRLRIHPAGRPPAARRVERLLALARLLAAQPAMLDGRRTIERAIYEQLRPPNAPSAERLQHAYGSWAAACRAAAGVLEDGRKRSVGTTAAWRVPPAARHTTDDVTTAVRRCADEIGRRPSSQDYHRWGIEKRARARAAGKREPIPDYSTVCRLYRARATRAGTTVWAAVLEDAFDNFDRNGDER